ncbi:Isochorismatase hydrolase [Gymnopus androsaceus JB14]|uniref:Isochorismatase hydrolase n=1 Tax=Gymnopus androsaceus JB14 TaxID=1447944 RepID=A0A6A4HD15_9AGAR|nr:Isochorismatase hydrolase [Gymnopus androsaceus JB14]
MAHTQSDTLFLICDIQSRFRSAIHGYEHVVATTNKMLKFAKLFGFPVVVTTQNSKALGPTDPDIDLASLGDLHLKTIDKTLFSMLVPEVRGIIDNVGPNNIVLMGIESHICILQTALSLLRVPSNKPNIYIIADATSSCNPFEVPLAFASLRQAGAQVLSSESMAFLLQGDAGDEGRAGKGRFREFAGIVKEEKERTKAAVEALFGVTKSAM